MTTPDIELDSPPKDGISRVQFSATDPNLLLAGSWDKTVRLYDVGREGHQLKTQCDNGTAVLDTCFGGDATAFAAGLDGSINRWDLEKNASTAVGRHDSSAKCVAWSSSQIVISGGWDKQLRLWDPRANNGTAQSIHEQPDKVYALSLADDRTVIVATAARHVWIWDLRYMQHVIQRRESSLKYQTRQVASRGNMYAVSSIEGRVAIEYLDPAPEAQAKKYAFKCHRQRNEEGKEVVHPVHSMAYNSLGTFATGGGDGFIYFWDPAAKKRLMSAGPYPTSIASMSFNADASKLAIASSYAFEQGQKDHPADAIFIKSLNAADIMPKK